MSEDSLKVVKYLRVEEIERYVFVYVMFDRCLDMMQNSDTRESFP